MYDKARVRPVWGLACTYSTTACRLALINKMAL